MTDKIEGLTLIEDVISIETENMIVQDIDSRLWNNDINRRTQHYGYKYPYKRTDDLLYADNNNMNNIEGLYKICESHVVKSFIKYIEDEHKIIADQCIVNEYYKDGKIGKHIDNIKYFDNTILSLSLLEPTLMRFTNTYDVSNKIDIILKPRSLLIMEDKARYDWKHEIPPLKSFNVGENKYVKSENYRRISLTCRKVLNKYI